MSTHCQKWHNKEKSTDKTFKLSPVTGLVVGALCAAFVVPLSAVGQEAVLNGQTTPGFEFIFQNSNGTHYTDTTDGTPNVNLYTVNLDPKNPAPEGTNSVLTINVDKHLPVFPQLNQHKFWIAGGLRTIPGGPVEDYENYEGYTGVPRRKIWFWAMGQVPETVDGLEAVNVYSFIESVPSLKNLYDYSGIFDNPEKNYLYVTTTGDQDGKPLNAPTSGQSLVVNFAKNASLMAKLYGGRNDLYNCTEVGIKYEDDNPLKGYTIEPRGELGTSGDANGNKVRIEFEKGSVLEFPSDTSWQDKESGEWKAEAPFPYLWAPIIFGGRSAQAEGMPAVQGFHTDENRVEISGDFASIQGLKANNWMFDSSDLKKIRNYIPEIVTSEGIWGAEGYQTNHNYVKIDNSMITGANENSRKFGIVGGRGFFAFRINQDREKLPTSAISNNNLVVINNSVIGLDQMYGQENAEYDDYYGTITYVWRSTEYGHAVSVVGGYSTGEARNNVVVAANSYINGSVYGGFELQDKLIPESEAGSPTLFRDLSPNLVSLKNVNIAPGNSIHGTASVEAIGDDSSTVYHQPVEGQTYLVQDSVKAINRRRGVAYVADEVAADSVYVRYIHFGQYLDPAKLDATKEFVVEQNYYPHVHGGQEIGTATIDKSGALPAATVFIENPEDPGAIALGMQVGGSYVLNRLGFRSDLSSTNDDNQSKLTNGLHNFWVGAYVNIVDKVGGDGTSFDTKVQLFEGGEKVNHNYSGGDLSLLVHDDGMYFDHGTDSDQSPSLMEHFRNHYEGLVLYTGANTGYKDPNAEDLDAAANKIEGVQISFQKIEEFRKQQEQNTNAFGNTFVGVIKDGNVYAKGSLENGDTSVKADEMTFSVPFTIYQKVDGVERPVADAEYGFYKYLHFDGKDGKFKDRTGAEVDGKVTESGKAAGIGVKYWLKSLSIRDGEMLTLNGKTKDSTLSLENFQAEGDPTKRPQELYTLSASLTGPGGIVIAPESTVVIGNPHTIYTIGSDPEPNTYTGETIVSENAVLAAGIDGVLGSEDSHTTMLTLKKGETTAFYLQSHKQTVGGLSVEEGAKVSLTEAAAITNNNLAGAYQADMGASKGVLTVEGNANIVGNIRGAMGSQLIEKHGIAEVHSANPEFNGEFVLDRAVGNLEHQEALVNAKAVVSAGSLLNFRSATAPLARVSDPRSAAYIGAIQNAGEVFLSKTGADEKISSLNNVYLTGNEQGLEAVYAGVDGSVIHYRGLVQGSTNSYVDVVHSATASGISTVSFGNNPNNNPASGVFKSARGEKTPKAIGIPVFMIDDKGAEGNQLKLEMQPFGVVAKDNEAYKWIYSLGYNDEEGGSQRTWVLYNAASEDDPGNLVLRPEGGAYVAASQSWAKMHMRLHDRFGQAYYIDPFDGEEKPAAAWVRQVGSHSHFRMEGGQGKTHSRTAVTQIGGDLYRNEINEDWKYIGGVFAGGLYNRADSRTWDSAKSRSDGYSLGVYGTLYTGNSPDDGFYVDTWLLFGRYDNKIWSDSINPFKYKSHGWVWSVETGYTIPLDETGTKDYNKLIWTFQPEAQIIWDGVKANSATDSFDTKYRQLGTDNVTLRVGARLHANYMNKGLGFIEGNWIHNTKKAGVELGNRKVFMDGGRNLGEFRMGLEGHLSRNTLGWATVGIQAGKAGYHNETAQIGIKYMF